MLFRLPGEFLLRLAARQLDAVLFQLPPRLTRLDAPAGALAPMFLERSVLEPAEPIVPGGRMGFPRGYQTTGGARAIQARRRARVSPRARWAITD